MLSACASHPNKIEAVYVPPEQYADYDCEQLAAELMEVETRTTELYQRIQQERTADALRAGVWLFLLWPSVFFLESEDGPEAALYARWKGEFEALRVNSERKNCELDIKSPEETIKTLDEEDKSKREEAESEETRPRLRRPPQPEREAARWALNYRGASGNRASVVFII